MSQTIKFHLDENVNNSVDQFRQDREARYILNLTNRSWVNEPENFWNDRSFR